MLINVSTLLTEPVGRSRDYVISDEPLVLPSNGAEARTGQTMSGELRLVRSDRGVLVMATLHVQPVSLECSRCLQPFEAPVYVEFDEEYVLERDPATGAPIEADVDEFHIDARRHLDLSEAVRQYEESALPIQPLCSEDCRGLCPECGQNLNESACEHGAQRIDHRWSGLAGLADQLRTEDSDGRSEA